MAKPIFIIRAPKTWTLDYVASVRNTLYNHASELTDEYHVLMLHDMELDEVKFECLNGDNSDNQELQEVKKITRLSIERCLRDEQEKKNKNK